MARRILLKEGGLTGSVLTGHRSIGVKDSNISIDSGSQSQVVDTYVTNVSLTGTDLNISSLGSGFSGTISLSSIAGTLDYKNIGSSSVTTTIDWSEAKTQEIYLDTDPTFTFINPVVGVEYNLIIGRDSEEFITWPTNIIWDKDFNGSGFDSTDLPVFATSDTTFSTGSGLNQFVTSVKFQQDGKLLYSGSFTTYNGVTASYLIRLTATGSLDSTFTASNINLNRGFRNSSGISVVNNILLQSDSKIVVGGGFTAYNGVVYNGIIRLNSDSSVDNTFNIGTGFSGGWAGSGTQINYILQQSDNRIVVGGLFTIYNGVNSAGIIRLNTNGSVDNTFNIGTGFSDQVPVLRSIIQQSDGKIIVGGSFTVYNGTSVNNLVRLNTNGSIDNSFSIGTGFNGAVTTMELQSDGRIIIGGSFTTYNGTTVNRIIRLNTDGSIDNTFSIGTGFNPAINVIKLQSDGKILVGGDFSTYNGNTSRRICRLKSNGEFDNIFARGGFLGSVAAMDLQSNKLAVGGSSMTAYIMNNVSFTRTNIERLLIYKNYQKVTLIWNGINWIGSLRQLYYN